MSGAPGHTPGLVALAAGLRFLPLTVLFRQPRFHLAGALRVAVGAAGCAVGLTTGSADTTRMIVDSGASAVLRRAAPGRRTVRICPGVTAGMLWSARPGQTLLLRR
ncbi:hypothetical protein BIV25_21620 [Streptomyces sp. MUSC 14]|uniref:hypothetical protein n=1 Tax=Streptomyces sp. MUSC 14 TaxID=1354889 RepID=UPI0008F5B5BE|nr:hypothetical protein [Streptomyces sp. MUSC 14]OIJ94681.1 hypothetical protein BIV25_21620 [Streptomyces sp. MUSC 14]